MTAPNDNKDINNKEDFESFKMKIAQEVNNKLVKEHEQYRKTLTYMSGDVPLGVLCLPAILEGILLEAGCLRVYDLFNRDLTKIKGIGETRSRDLSARLDQFLSMC